MNLFISSFAIPFLLATQLSADIKAVLDLDKITDPGDSIVWSPLFQATWDKLNAQHGGKPIKVEPENKLMMLLDSMKWDEKSVMPVGGYATFSGPATKAFAAQTAKQIQEQFGVDMPASQVPDNPAGIAAYGVLVRDLNFEKEFFKSKSSLMQFRDRKNKIHKVAFFGTKGNHSAYYAQKVRVLRYENEGSDFILSISTKMEGERVIIYKPAIVGTLRTAMNQVLESQKNLLDGKYGSLKDPNLHAADTVKIPFVSFNNQTEFLDQLQGARYYKGDPTPWTMSAAYQITQFELSEKGAKVKIHSGSADAPFGDPQDDPQIFPRNFICDQSFYVFLWKDGAELPYLAVMIDSVDEMKPESIR